MKVKISKENWINATTDFKGKFWCPIERQESLLNVWPNSVDIEIEVDKPNTKKVKKYRYSRKEIVKMIKTKCFFGHNESKAVRWLLATQPKTQPIKEESKDIGKLNNNIGVKLSSTVRGQRELIREMRNKINEVIDTLNSLTKRNIK